MAVHDAYARLTPYELLLPSPDFADERFPAIEAEAGARGTDLHNPAAFTVSGPVQGILAELRPDDDGPAAVAPEEAAPDASALQGPHVHGEVLFFAYHLWRTARPHGPPGVTLITQRTLRSLLAGAGADEQGRPAPRARAKLENPPAAGASNSGWERALRGCAGYVQLPQHMVWADEAGAARPESVDGFFWAAAPEYAFHAAAVAGMRQGRPGYGVIPAPPQPLNSLSSWTTAPAREGGGEFSTNLPGAQLDGLVGIRTPAELLKLVALALERSTRRPRKPVRSPAAPSSAAAAPSPPAAPSLSPPAAPSSAAAAPSPPPAAPSSAAPSPAAAPSSAAAPSPPSPSISPPAVPPSPPPSSPAPSNLPYVVL